MTDVKLINEKVANSGLRKSFIAEKLGITYQALLNKLSGKSEFKTTEVAVMCDLLRISSLEEKERIFFAIKVDE